MIINVASQNQVKVDAVRELVKDYDFISRAEVHGLEFSSGVSEQPKSLEETISGATNRAREVFDVRCSYSFGIESGLMQVPQTKTGNMNICACAVYDGKNHHLGLSCAFEFPPAVTRMIHGEGIDVNEAFFRCGLTANRRIGSFEGAIGMLTRERMTRKDYTKQAIQMALIHLENSDLYKI